LACVLPAPATGEDVKQTDIYARFKQHGVPFLLKPILNGEHGGGDANEIEDAYKTMRQFIIRHLAADDRRKP
jgi:hypothetical protein